MGEHSTMGESISGALTSCNKYKLEPLILCCVHIQATYNTSFVWVTQSYAHLRCQTFQTPVNEFVPIQPEDYGLDKFLWRNFPQYDQMSKDLAKIHVI